MKKFVISIAVLVVILAAGLVLFMDSAIAPDTTDEPTPTTSPSPTAQPNITIESPKSGDKVSNPIIVKGKARVFENSFSYALRDTAGKKLYENHAMTDAPDAGIFGNYTVKIPVPSTAPRNLIVEVFEYSAKDGSVTNLVRVPVELSSQETTSLKAYFNNSNLDPEFSCNKTFPVDRTVYKTNEPAFVALSELLAGPTQAEKNSAFSTSIPTGVRINSIVISGGTARVDFNETLEAGVGGSCRVSAIRSQISNTLKQFPSVQNVIISINGRTEDILQP